MPEIKYMKIKEVRYQYGRNTSCYVIDMPRTLNLLINAQALGVKKTKELKKAKFETSRSWKNGKNTYREMTPESLMDIETIQADYKIEPVQGYVVDFGNDSDLDDEVMSSGAGTKEVPMVIV